MCGASFLGEPTNSISSLAFVVAGVGVLLRARSAEIPPHRPTRPLVVTYALLVIAVGVGSYVQHGPHPPWQEYAHDLPLAATLAFIATDAASAIVERKQSPLWWIAPTIALIPIIAIGPTASTIAQSAMAALAIGLSLVRIAIRPAARRTVLISLAILALGAALGTLPDQSVPSHAIWHVCAATALWWLSPVVGAQLGRE